MSRAHSPLLIVLGLVAGCGTPAPPILLVDDPGIRRDDPRLVYGAKVTIGGEPRRVLSAVKPIATEAKLVDTEVPAVKSMHTTIPPLPSGVPTFVIAAANLEDGVPVAIRVWPMLAIPSAPQQLLVYAATLTPGKTVVAAIWPVVPLAERDLETGPVKIPAGTALTVGLGLEPQCVEMVPVPAVLSVTAVDEAGTATTLHEASLHMRPGQRKWVDAVIALDQLAGRAVRFRFGTRTTLPAVGVYALPVFAEPTIVAAETPARR